jgi:hypothetical protein
MATVQAGRAARNLSTRPRRSFLRKTTAPDAFAPCTWNTFFARSNPIVLTSDMDASVQVMINDTTLAQRCREGASTPSTSAATRARRSAKPSAQPGRSCSFSPNILARSDPDRASVRQVQASLAQSGGANPRDGRRRHWRVARPPPPTSAPTTPTTPDTHKLEFIPLQSLA